MNKKIGQAADNDIAHPGKYRVCGFGCFRYPAGNTFLGGGLPILQSVLLGSAARKSLPPPVYRRLFVRGDLFTVETGA